MYGHIRSFNTDKFKKGIVSFYSCDCELLEYAYDALIVCSHFWSCSLCGAFPHSLGSIPNSSGGGSVLLTGNNETRSCAHTGRR